MTVQEIMYYLQHLQPDKQVQVYGGGMQIISSINHIVTNHQDPMNAKGGVVLLIAGGGKLPEPLKLPPPPPVEPKSITGAVLNWIVDHWL